MGEQVRRFVAEPGTTDSVGHRYGQMRQRDDGNYVAYEDYEALRMANGKLVAAANSLLNDLPALLCEHFHHSNRDRHDAVSLCPVLTRFEVARARLVTTLLEVQ